MSKQILHFLTTFGTQETHCSTTHHVIVVFIYCKRIEFMARLCYGKVGYEYGYRYPYEYGYMYPYGYGYRYPYGYGYRYRYRRSTP